MDRLNRKHTIDSATETAAMADSKDKLLGRRSYIKAFGATALSAGAAASAAGTVSADEGDYDVIEVSPGQRWSYDLDDGEVFENYVIDISADGAEALLNARGNDWTIRNVGFRGVWDTYERAHFVFAEVQSSSSTGRIENVYIGDGAIGDTYPNGPNGIFVSARHAGDLLIDNVNIQGTPDNAIYGCEPGRSDEYHGSSGAGGDVIISNSYARNCRAGGFRIGTDGSRVENCVAVGCDRNIWVRFNNPTAVDCDSSDAVVGDVAVGGMGWSSRISTHAALTAQNCSYQTTNFQESTNRVIGDSIGPARRTEPEEIEGVPLTAEEAASGSGSPPAGTGDEPDAADGRLLAFVTDPDAEFASYEFTAEGPVEFTDAGYESPSGGSIEGGTFSAEDFIDADGETVRAGGTTGGGYGDAFLVDGPITEIDLEQSDVMWIELDGEEMTVEEVIEATAASEPDLLAFVTEPDARFASYDFTAEGTVEFTDAGYESPSGGSIEGGTFSGEDFIDAEGDIVHAGGTTGGGHGDAFLVDGPVTEIDLEQPEAMWIELNGEEMTVEEVIEATSDDEAEAEDETDDEPKKVLIVDATDATEPVSYSFSVSESLEATTYQEATINEDATVTENSVEGSVVGERDAYLYSGAITGFRLAGNATVDITSDVQ